MHPVIVQAAATERSAEMRAYAAAARRARASRRARPGHLGLVARVPKSRPAPRPLRGPEAA